MKQTLWKQFLPLISVFFFWGFVGAGNSLLIPVFKKYFILSQFQAQLVEWAFYAAYFVGSLIFFFISLKTDILQIFGYKKTLAAGLSLSALGAFLFYPAAATANFWMFLFALFTVGLGFSVQQIVANPLAIKMGSPETGSHRLTLAGAINSLGTTIAPIILGVAIFGSTPKIDTKPDTSAKGILTEAYVELSKELQANKKELLSFNTSNEEIKESSIQRIETIQEKIGVELLEVKNGTTESSVLEKKQDEIKKEAAQIIYPKKFIVNKLSLVRTPFIILGISFLLVAIFLLYSRIENPEKVLVDKSLEKETFSIVKYPQLILGMIAIFVYVGTEVTIASNLPALLHTAEFGSILEQNIAPFISLYWGSLMIGRWNGSMNVFKTSPIVSAVLKCIVPIIAFSIIVFANLAGGKNISWQYLFPWITFFIIMSYIAGKKPGKTLLIFGISGVLMMLIGMFYPDKLMAQYFLIAGGLFCSVLWPAIFDLSIAGLGKHTGKASSFLIMMIIGGGLIPLIQGKICDLDAMYPEGIVGLSYTHFSYIVPALGFVYLAVFGFITPKILKTKGVYDVVS